MALEHPIFSMAHNIHSVPQGRLLHQTLSSGWVAIARFGVNKTALNKAGIFWRGKFALAALWVDMADSSVLSFLTCKTGQCNSLTSQRCSAGNGLYSKTINGMEKPAMKGKNSQMFSSVLVIPETRETEGYTINVMEKNSKEVPLFCKYFCLVPQPDHTRLTAGDYVKSVLQG